MKISFYCKVCGTDSDIPEGNGPRDCHFDSLSTGESYIWGKCPECNCKVVRYVTEQQIDPYFTQSKRLRRQRKELKRDLIQPGQPGFQTLYPKQWKQIEEATARVHEREEAEKKSKLDFYKRYRHTKEEDSMRAFLKAEEK